MLRWSQVINWVKYLPVFNIHHNYNFLYFSKVKPKNLLCLQSNPLMYKMKKRKKLTKRS